MWDVQPEGKVNVNRFALGFGTERAGYALFLKMKDTEDP